MCLVRSRLWVLSLTSWIQIWRYVEFVGVRFNPLHAKFFRGNKNIYLHFMLFLHIDMTQVVEILPQVRQELTYYT